MNEKVPTPESQAHGPGRKLEDDTVLAALRHEEYVTGLIYGLCPCGSWMGL